MVTATDLPFYFSAECPGQTSTISEYKLFEKACLYSPESKMIIVDHGTPEAFVLVDSFNWGVSKPNPNFSPAPFHLERENPVIVDGLCTSLAGPWSFNYYHWCEELARAVWLEKEGVHPTYTIPNEAALYAESLRYFGVDAERIVAFRGAPIVCSQYLSLPQVHLNEPAQLHTGRGC